MGTRPFSGILVDEEIMVGCAQTAQELVCLYLSYVDYFIVGNNNVQCS